MLCFGFLLGTVFAQSSQPVASPPSSPSTAETNATNDAPVTVRSDWTKSQKTADNEPVVGVPPLPQGKTSLVGGKVSHIDGVKNRLGVKVFGGGKWNVAFDERTHFYRDGVETTFENIKKGDRVYVDTMLDGPRIFARNVRVVTKIGSADARGHVLSLDNQYVTIQDELSDRPVQFAVSGNTQIRRNSSTVALSQVHPGSIIRVQFAPERENLGVASFIDVLASPGQSITFAGKVRHLDIRNKELAVENHSDSKTYEIALDRDRALPANLMVGSEVNVAAIFDGKQYKAAQISVK
jgi:hypothetical protein